MDASRSAGSTKDGGQDRRRSVLDGLSHTTVANALLVGGLLVVPLTFVGGRGLSNQLFWQIVGTGLLSVAVGFLAAPRARIAWLKPLQRSLFFDRSEAELTFRATSAYVLLGLVFLAIAGWVLFLSTKV